jgi:hypothetical protein
MSHGQVQYVSIKSVLEKLGHQPWLVIHVHQSTFITGELDFKIFDEYVSILKGLHNTRSTNISLPKEKEKKGLG